jgi:predicted Zn-dependent protease
MRAIRQQLLPVVLVCSGVLVATLSLYGRKNENNPNKIGHRTVAHRSIVSLEKESEIGKRQAEQFERSVRLLQDSVVDRYVSIVVDNVSRNSDWKGPLVVKVVRSPEVESLSLPGGFIYLTSGLLLAADNDDQVAGAIAHQVAHAAARHWASQITKMTITEYAPLPLLFTSALMACSGFSGRYSDGAWLSVLRFSREAELEADYLGLQYVYKAGYDPNAYVALLRKLPPQDAASQGLPDVFRATPPTPQRISKAEEEIRKILPCASLQPKSSADFVLMKSRL